MPDFPTAAEQAAILAQLEKDLAEQAEQRARGESVDKAPSGGHNRAMLMAAVIAGCG